MTTGIYTTQLEHTEIVALVEALERHAFRMQRRALSLGRSGSESIDGILSIVAIILRLHSLSENCDQDFNLPPMIFTDTEASMAEAAIDECVRVCERNPDRRCAATECRQLELSTILRSIRPRLSQDWSQASGHAPGVDGAPSTIWIT